MIDPTRITRYDHSIVSLQEFLFFCILVANKPAQRTAQVLENFLGPWPRLALTPLNYVEDLIVAGELEAKLRQHKVGQYRRIYRCFREIVQQRHALNLGSCGPEILEAIHGIGPKTARFFILHSRKDAQVAVLDTHMLKHLRSLGLTKLKDTPSSPRVYRQLELMVLGLAAIAGQSPAEYDLAIWNQYSKKPAV